MRTKIVAIVLLLTSVFVWAVVPNQFTAGTPARASEVNANFSALDNGITSNTTRIQQLEDDAATIQRHSFSYAYIPAAVGSTVTLLNTDYKVVKMPFIEMATNDRYAITFLANVAVLTTSERIFSNISIRHYSKAKKCPFINMALSTITIDGIQAEVGIDDTVQHRFSSSLNTSTNTGTAEFTTKTDYSVNACFLIGETSLFFSVWITKDAQLDGSVAIDDFDFTDNITWENVGHDALYLQALDDLIDYIKIEKLP